MNESNQIIELLNDQNTTFKNISYKSVNRTKLNNTNNNSFSNNRIRFNTKELSNHLVPYEDAYNYYIKRGSEHIFFWHNSTFSIISTLFFKKLSHQAKIYF